MGQLLQDKGNVVKIVNYMSMSPSQNFICCKMSLVVRSNVVLNAMTLNKIFNKFVGDGFGKSITGKKKLNACENKCYLFHDINGSMLLPYHQVTGWCSPGRVPCWGLIVGLHYWLVKYSLVSEARWALVSRNPCF